jgi:hypothetical protein
MMASGVTFAAVADAVGLRNAPVSDPDLVMVVPQMAWMILLVGPASPDFSSFSPLPF